MLEKLIMTVVAAGFFSYLCYTAFLKLFFFFSGISVSETPIVPFHVLFGCGSWSCWNLLMLYVVQPATLLSQHFSLARQHSGQHVLYLQLYHRSKTFSIEILIVVL